VTQQLWAGSNGWLASKGIRIQYALLKQGMISQSEPFYFDIPAKEPGISKNSFKISLEIRAHRGKADAVAKYSTI